MRLGLRKYDPFFCRPGGPIGKDDRHNPARDRLARKELPWTWNNARVEIDEMGRVGR